MSSTVILNTHDRKMENLMKYMVGIAGAMLAMSLVLMYVGAQYIRDLNLPGLVNNANATLDAVRTHSKRAANAAEAVATPFDSYMAGLDSILGAATPTSTIPDTQLNIALNQQNANTALANSGQV